MAQINSYLIQRCRSCKCLISLNAALRNLAVLVLGFLIQAESQLRTPERGALMVAHTVASVWPQALLPRCTALLSTLVQPPERRVEVPAPAEAASGSAAREANPPARGGPAEWRIVLYAGDTSSPAALAVCGNSYSQRSRTKGFACKWLRHVC